MPVANMNASTFQMTDAHWNLLRKSGERHKYDYGHAVIISGPAGQGGAARLAARGALRIGAGLVSVVCQSGAIAEHAAQLNAIMVKPFATADALPQRLADIKTGAICIGPNLGLDQTAQKILAHCLSMSLPMCLDADAISLMADITLDLPAVSNAQSVLTPHAGELRRYIPEFIDTTNSRTALAQYAAEKAGCVVLFKGPQTVVAAPDGRAAIVSSSDRHDTGWLATAGSGDVLAGFVTGLLARGLDAFDAATIATELHFCCADQFGSGLIAEDIPEMLPRVLRR
ncbi:NAD(P)H-hydrate dehydratase [uncultured Sulfitobacter sp.]|uniref:NAD(P)H-hydrate dehydratase n=1 Tax=uncultured Sulfitobacter sp. TaxID=191468 RepID=UPI0026107C18|nr:NAD(P)H-hydrate dehydratase [uncultured Sulfitobacter sp.]